MNRKTQRNTRHPILARTAMVFEPSNHRGRRPSTIRKKGRQSDTKKTSSSYVKTKLNAVSRNTFLRRRLLALGVTQRAQKYMLRAWMPNTLKSYDLYKQKWRTYCLIRGVDPMKPSEKKYSGFLRRVSRQRSCFSTNSARSTLSHFLPPIGNRRVGQTDMCVS